MGVDAIADKLASLHLGTTETAAVADAAFTVPAAVRQSHHTCACASYTVRVHVAVFVSQPQQCVHMYASVYVLATSECSGFV